MSFNYEEHLPLFFQETQELLQEIEAQLLQVEGTFDNKDLIDHLFRNLHTIKGTSEMYGYQEISVFSHDLEEAFHLVRDGKMIITAELVDLTLAGCDQIRKMLEKEDIEEGVNEQIIENLHRLMPKEGQGSPEEKLETVSSTSEDVIYSILIHPALDFFLDGSDPILLLNELRDLGDCFIVAQTDVIHHFLHKVGVEQVNTEACYTHWEALLKSSCQIEDIQEVFEFVEDKVQLEIQALESNDPADEDYFEELKSSLEHKGYLFQKALHQVQASQRALTADGFSIIVEPQNTKNSGSPTEDTQGHKSDHLSPFIRSLFSKNTAYAFQLKLDDNVETLRNHLEEELKFQLKDFEERWIELQVMNWNKMAESGPNPQYDYFVGQLIFRLQEINRFLEKNSGPPVIKYICSEIYEFLRWEKVQKYGISPTVISKVAMIFAVLNTYLAEDFLELNQKTVEKIASQIRKAVEELLTLSH